ncbi:MAG: DEAD/DEAH box helicase [Dethiobacteria bacterium]|jgi:DEAD/DEAH box helicase domain-containing protein
MSIRNLISTIQGSKELRKQVATIIEKAEVPPRYGKLSSKLPAALQQYLRRKQIYLYSHQAEVIEKVRSGSNVALVTSTASGKTLAFTIPIFEQLLKVPNSSALILYPMKALSYDQLKEIRELEKETSTQLGAAVYDGDTPKERRRSIRENSRLILSNPHALHYYLAWHRLWKGFFRKLRLVVIDEAHWYRGIFGTNVAFLLRRLRRILEYYGSDPQFIISSATMADPLEHAALLTGKDFELVNRDGSSRGKKTYLFWDTSRKPDHSQHLQTAELTAASVQHGLQTLCFSVSRKMAELTAAWANKLVTDREIVPYRAGYLPEDRRKLEKKFKEKQIAGIISTNALELGINIGGLDVVVLGGYPGTISSFHQRAGRAGRLGQESLVVQILFDNPLDTYLQANPHYLFEEPSEQAIISLENRQILKNHIMCAAEELPLVKEDAGWFGGEYERMVGELIREKAIRPFQSHQQARRPSASTKSYRYNGSGSFFKVSLSDIEGSSYRLICDGQVLEELSRRQAYSEAHPGAIFLHRAESYQVVDFDEGFHKIKLKPFDKDTYTTPLRETRVKIDEVLGTRMVAGYDLHYGRVTVDEEVYGYNLRSFSKTLAKNTLERPLSLQYTTEGIWINFSKLAVNDPAGGLHAVEHLLIGVAPLLAMCDRWDLGGVCTASRQLFLYDAFPEGIGISRRLYQNYEVLTAKALEVIRECPCQDGCPKCIISPKCGNNNEPLHKDSARAVLESLTR